MIDIQEKKKKIISFVEANGPSLPVQIAKAIEMDPVFASAILSELLGNRQIKMSHMKVGSSPLYLLPGQEQKLEKLTDNLKSIEKEAYLKLKEKKILRDENENPAIRVALRGLKDFAVPFKFQEKVLWKYAFASDEEIKRLLDSKTKEIRPKSEPEESVRKPASTREDSGHAEKHKEAKEHPKVKKVENIFAKSGAEDKTKPEFLSEIRKFLEGKRIKFLEEIQSERKEVVARVAVSSEIGEISFLLIAKNKRTTSKEEISAAIQRALYNKMPCLFIIRKAPSKSIQKLIEGNNLIKVEVME